MSLLVECECCSTDTNESTIIFCDSDSKHGLCFNCIQQNISTLLQVLKIDLKCISTSSCTGSIHESDLARALDEKLLSRYYKVQQQIYIRNIYKDNIITCPFCSFDMVQDEKQYNNVLVCMNDDCRRQSCTLCKKESHFPNLCNNNDTKRKQDEEKDTYNVIKACPTCNVDILRISGCTHMTCSRCNTIMCYTCGANITDNVGAHGCKLFPELDNTTTAIQNTINFNEHANDYPNYEANVANPVRNNVYQIMPPPILVPIPPSIPTPYVHSSYSTVPSYTYSNIRYSGNPIDPALYMQQYSQHSRPNPRTNNVGYLPGYSNLNHSSNIAESSSSYGSNDYSIRQQKIASNRTRKELEGWNKDLESWNEELRIREQQLQEREYELSRSKRKSKHGKQRAY